MFFSSMAINMFGNYFGQKMFRPGVTLFSSFIEWFHYPQIISQKYTNLLNIDKPFQLKYNLLEARKRKHKKLQQIRVQGTCKRNNKLARGAAKKPTQTWV